MGTGVAKKEGAPGIHATDILHDTVTIRRGRHYLLTTATNFGLLPPSLSCIALAFAVRSGALRSLVVGVCIVHVVRRFARFTRPLAATAPALRLRPAPTARRGREAIRASRAALQSLAAPASSAR